MLPDQLPPPDGDGQDARVVTGAPPPYLCHAMPTIMQRLTSALADRYTIERELGAGGMATVYLATDLKHHRPVAIKVLRPELAAVLGAERFLQEIEVTANLRHPHILPLFDSGEADSFLFYVMPFAEGESLRALLDRVGTLPVSQAVQLTQNISAALAHAHDHGVVHRDIKPENILLVDDEALVADFGIALNASAEDSTRLTGTGLSLGTPTYMSPEQIDGQTEIDHRTDVYALGCMLYEMLVGEPPFTGPTIQAIIASSMADKPPSVHKARGDVPVAFDRVIDRALAKSPEDRFNSVREFSDALSIPVAATPTRPWLRFAVAALVVVAGWLGLSFRQANQRATAQEMLPRIAALAATGDYQEAYALAVEAERHIGTDPVLDSLMYEVSDLLSVTTEPSGGQVVVTPFSDGGTSAEPIFEGFAPIVDLRIPRIDHLVSATLPGHALAQRIAASALQRWRAIQFSNPDIARPISFNIGFLPEEEGTDAVLVPGGSYRLVGPDVPQNSVTELTDFVIGRFEVTNEEFKSFVMRGGYASDDSWEDTPARIRATLTDRSGLPGPRNWVGQEFVEGQDRHPVTGITWYEATAYCASRNSRLPSVFEWEKADRNGHRTGRGAIMPWGLTADVGAFAGRANFNGSSTSPVDAHPFGISQFGAYAMAGNAKEWLVNQMGSGYVVTGGSWEDPSYLYPQYGSQSGVYTSQSLGFRCARTRNGDDTNQGLAPIDVDERTPNYTPVGRATFNTLLSHYQYDRQPAEPRGITTSETDGWTRERLWINGVQGDSVLLYFYAPTQAPPPYQTMVYVPGSGTFCCQAVSDATEFMLGPVIRGGRAALVVAVDGMIERPRPPGSTLPATNSVRFRDDMVRHATEIRLGVDYLEERNDVDLDRIAYVGMSWGAGSRIGFAALDDRFKSFVLIAAGIDERVKPTLPEADNVNFAPYIDGPKIMINGRNDEEHNWFSRALPMWNLLSEPKELVLIEGAGHAPPVESRIPAINTFLDRTLGPVERR